MRYDIRPTDRHVNGYGRCWYCDCDVIDPTIYSVTDRYDGVEYIVVCDADACTDAADSGELADDAEADDVDPEYVAMIADNAEDY